MQVIRARHATTPGGRRRRAGGPPAWSLEVVGLVGLYGVSGALCLYGAVLPPTEVAPRTVNAVFAGLAMAVAVLAVARRGRLPRPAVHALLATYSIGVGISAASAGTDAGAVSAGVAAVWVCLYAAICLGHWPTRLHGTLAVSALAVGISHSVGGGAGWSAWSVVALSAMLAGELLSRAHGQVRTLARTDSLTGAVNRMGLDEAAAVLLRRAARDGTILTAAVIDLDGFKAVNDQAGHAAGDRMLMALVDEWRRAIRTGDVIARTGGDEFVLLLPGTDADAADRLLARLRRKSTGAWSYGLAQLEPGDDLASLLDRADASLYVAKQARR